MEFRLGEFFRRLNPGRELTEAERAKTYQDDPTNVKPITENVTGEEYLARTNRVGELERTKRLKEAGITQFPPPEPPTAA